MHSDAQNVPPAGSPTPATAAAAAAAAATAADAADDAAAAAAAATADVSNATDSFKRKREPATEYDAGQHHKSPRGKASDYQNATIEKVTCTKSAAGTGVRTTALLDSSRSFDRFPCTICAAERPRDEVWPHPLFQVAICGECLHTVCDGIEKDEDSAEDPDACAWCWSEDETTLLLCDECPYGFCRDCIAKNLGDAQLRQIESADPWLCFICAPAPLSDHQRLFKLTARPATSNEQRAHEMIEELRELETRVDDIHVQLEDKSIAGKRTEFEHEFTTGDPLGDVSADARPVHDDVIHRVEDEMTLYIELLNRSLRSLESWKGMLQHALEPVLRPLNITIASVYLSFEEGNAKLDQEDESANVWGSTVARLLYKRDSDGDGWEPDDSDSALETVRPLMRKAKKELAKSRPVDEHKGASGWKSDQPDLYEAETPRQAHEMGIEGADSIDEIDTIDPDEEDVLAATVGLQSRRRPSAKEYETAFEAEERDGITLAQRAKIRRKTTAYERRGGSRKLDSDSSDGDESDATAGDRGPLWKSKRAPAAIDLTDDTTDAGHRPAPPPPPPPPRINVPRQRPKNSDMASSSEVVERLRCAWQGEPLTREHFPKGNIWRFHCLNNTKPNMTSSGDTPILLHWELEPAIKPHQIEGVQFMWQNCIVKGKGCILAHCMGLGKTFQVITLIRTLYQERTSLSLRGSKRKHRSGDYHAPPRIMVCVPKNTVFNWQDEFNRWAPLVTKFTVDSALRPEKREEVIRNWHMTGGVVIIGKETLAGLIEKAEQAKASHSDTSAEIPKPCLLVVDEAHFLKDNATKISRALSKIDTKKRIGLTGTPFQNNLKEYYSMVSFLREKSLGSFASFQHQFINPIENGQHADSTDEQVKVMKRRTFALNKKLLGAIHRCDHTVLEKTLPPKKEYVVFTRLSPLQIRLYEAYLAAINDAQEDTVDKSLLTAHAVLRKIWTHPELLIRTRAASPVGETALAEVDNVDDPYRCSTVAVEPELDTAGTEPQRLPDWCRKIFSESEMPHDFSHSPKMLLLLELLKLCLKSRKEKVLVFSQSTRLLDLIERALLESPHPDPSDEEKQSDPSCCWRKHHYFRLDGTSNSKERQRLCTSFNEEGYTPGGSSVFLISTLAGGQGINLVAASRCIIMDDHWNPAVNQQALFRCYRYGQTRPVVRV
jgi:hypothetical protein